ncbi:MAG: alkaline phosphatase family protein [Kouleothrix sp.]
MIFAANTLPNFVWITQYVPRCTRLPGKCRECMVAGVIPQILNSPAWKDNGALFITFDEGEKLDGGGCCQYSQGGHIATLVISPLVPAGFRSNVGYSHYSLLRTIETAWGLPPLGKLPAIVRQLWPISLRQLAPSHNRRL